MTAPVTANPYTAPAQPTAGVPAEERPVDPRRLRLYHRLFAWLLTSGIGVNVLATVLMVLVLPVGFALNDQAAIKAALEGTGKGAILVSLVAIGLVSMLGTLAMIAGIVFQLMLHHGCWRTLRADQPLTTPGRAVGFLFIPIYNLYWMFISFGGLGRELDRVLRVRGLRPAPFRSMAITGIAVLLLIASIAVQIQHIRQPSIPTFLIPQGIMLAMLALFLWYHAGATAAAIRLAEHDRRAQGAV